MDLKEFFEKIKAKIGEAYLALENKYYEASDFLQEKAKIPVYKYFIDPIESKGIPSLPILASIALAIVVTVSLILSGGQATADLTVKVSVGKAPVEGLIVSLGIFDVQRKEVTNKGGIAQFKELPLGKKLEAKVYLNEELLTGKDVIIGETNFLSIEVPPSEKLISHLQLQVADNANSPLRDVQITINGQDIRFLAHSDENGNLIFPNLQVGQEVEITAKKEGFEDITKKIIIGQNNSISLQQKPIENYTIKVTTLGSGNNKINGVGLSLKIGNLTLFGRTENGEYSFILGKKQKDGLITATKVGFKTIEKTVQIQNDIILQLQDDVIPKEKGKNGVRISLKDESGSGINGKVAIFEKNTLINLGEKNTTNSIADFQINENIKNIIAIASAEGFEDKTSGLDVSRQFLEIFLTKLSSEVKTLKSKLTILSDKRQKIASKIMLYNNDSILLHEDNSNEIEYTLNPGKYYATIKPQDSRYITTQSKEFQAGESFEIQVLENKNPANLTVGVKNNSKVLENADILIFLNGKVLDNSKTRTNGNTTFLLEKGKQYTIKALADGKTFSQDATTQSNENYVEFAIVDGTISEPSKAIEGDELIFGAVCKPCDDKGIGLAYDPKEGKLAHSCSILNFEYDPAYPEKSEVPIILDEEAAKLCTQPFLLTTEGPIDVKNCFSISQDKKKLIFNPDPDENPECKLGTQTAYSAIRIGCVQMPKTNTIYFKIKPNMENWNFLSEFCTSFDGTTCIITNTQSSDPDKALCEGEKTRLKNPRPIKVKNLILEPKEVRTQRRWGDIYLLNYQPPTGPTGISYVKTKKMTITADFNPDTPSRLSDSDSCSYSIGGSGFYTQNISTKELNIRLSGKFGLGPCGIRHCTDSGCDTRYSDKQATADYTLISTSNIVADKLNVQVSASATAYAGVNYDPNGVYCPIAMPAKASPTFSLTAVSSGQIIAKSISINVNAENTSASYKETLNGTDRYQQQGVANLKINALPSNLIVNGKPINIELLTSTTSQVENGQTGKCPEEPEPYKITRTKTTTSQSLTKTFS